MSAFFLLLLRILFPLNPVRQLSEIVREYICLLIDAFDDGDDFEALANDPERLALLEGHIDVTEEEIHAIIGMRAREIAGLRYIRTRGCGIGVPRRRARDIATVMRRFQRLLTLFYDIERLATIRAKRFRREVDRNPLGVEVPHPITAPTLCVDADTHRRLYSSSAQHWVMWHARVRAYDGGGSHARGPPRLSIANC
jgi:hypothetical protein